MKKKTILYYVPYKSTAMCTVLQFAKKSGFRCEIATSAKMFYIKCKRSNIVAYDTLYQKHITRLVSLLPRSKLIICNTNNLNEAVKCFNRRELSVEKVKERISAFFEYINITPLNTSSILIKHTLFYMIDNNITHCNYKILALVCKELRLDWEQEKSFLRKHSKIWYEKNWQKFIELYPNIKITEFKVTTFIDALFVAYEYNYHKSIQSSIVKLKNKIDSLIKKDTLVLQNLFNKQQAINN